MQSLPQVTQRGTASHARLSLTLLPDPGKTDSQPQGNHKESQKICRNSNLSSRFMPPPVMLRYHDGKNGGRHGRLNDNHTPEFRTRWQVTGYQQHRSGEYNQPQQACGRGCQPIQKSRWLFKDQVGQRGADENQAHRNRTHRAKVHDVDGDQRDTIGHPAKVYRNRRQQCTHRRVRQEPPSLAHWEPAQDQNPDCPNSRFASDIENEEDAEGFAAEQRGDQRNWDVRVIVYARGKSESAPPLPNLHPQDPPAIKGRNDAECHRGKSDQRRQKQIRWRAQRWIAQNVFKNQAWVQELDDNVEQALVRRLGQPFETPEPDANANNEEDRSDQLEQLPVIGHTCVLGPAPWDLQSLHADNRRR